MGSEGTGALRGRGQITDASLSLSALFILIFCIVAVHGKEALIRRELWVVFVLIGSSVLCSAVTVLIWRQPESKTKLSFKVSGSPTGLLGAWW